MQKERAYGFRNELNQVHRRDRRDFSRLASDKEITIENGWRILIDVASSELVKDVALDLQHYLFQSMNVSVLVEKVAEIEKFIGQEHTIVMATIRELPKSKHKFSSPNKSYYLQVDSHGVVICGSDERGMAQGSYYLEDLMNLAEAPILARGESVRTALFSPRMVHSGWGIDSFPDTYLNAVAHAGIDAVLVFTKGCDLTTTGYLDFNDLIARAAKYAIDVYFYSYLKSLKHPSHINAEDYYDSTYGRLFESCPGAKGVILVGESCEFPSHDPNTTGKTGNDFHEGIRPTKPRPGWWPCFDYPEWLETVKRSVKKYSPKAEIVFWTYNWGYTPEKDRIALINALPEDVTLQVTFEMFEPLRLGNAVKPVMDYSITFPGPGKYFSSEAATARRRNIRLYAMSNTGGMTWDFGTVPYIPVPQQWSKRHDAILKAQDDWGLCGLMESHHYGFTPSIISELSKWRYWTPSPDTEKVIELISVRDFGEAGAPHAVEAWQLWSEAMSEIPVTNEDQYGPLRVGPAYPLIFHPDITRDFQTQEIKIPSADHAHFGSRIVKTFYHPFENEHQSPGAIRFPLEIKALERAIAKWQAGINKLDLAIKMAPEKKRPQAFKMLGLGEFILSSLVTTRHCKQWWILNHQLIGESDIPSALKLLNELKKIMEAEISNAEAAIPLVEKDSRLGWEPSMEYIADREHLEWKIRHCRQVIEYDLPTYKAMLLL